jgi:FtsP/CotA-like multicopper oxidase with cupredoxin domain
MAYAESSVMYKWLVQNWRTMLQILAWLLLFFAGGSGFTTLTTDVQTLKAQIAALQGANATLQRALDLANIQLDEAHKQIQFLQDCLTRPLPWPGGSLCPKPQE